VEPAIQVHYRASTVKQYFKEGRALRTETTVNDTRDFGIGRRLTQANWDALLAIGHQVNQRFLEHQLDACQCAPDATTLQRVVLPSIEDGLPAPGLRFGEPRTMALLACLCSLLVQGPHVKRRVRGCQVELLLDGGVRVRGCWCVGCCARGRPALLRSTTRVGSGPAT
jgi:hypothetical protein